MVLADAVAWLTGGNGRLALGVALLAVALYYRKALGLGRILQTWAGRVAFSAVAVGVLLILGIIPGINVDTAVGYAEQLVDLGGQLIAELREVVGA